MSRAIALLALLFATAVYADISAENILYLKKVIAAATYLTMTDADVVATLARPVVHTFVNYIDTKGLYEDIGPEKTEAFMSILRTLSDPAKYPGTATIAANFVTWIDTTYGVNIGAAGIRDWLNKIGAFSAGVAAAFKPVMDLGLISTSPNQDQGWGTATLADVAAARALP